jgi:hypothetical protein
VWIGGRIRTNPAGQAGANAAHGNPQGVQIAAAHGRQALTALNPGAAVSPVVLDEQRLDIRGKLLETPQHPQPLSIPQAFVFGPGQRRFGRPGRISQPVQVLCQRPAPDRTTPDFALEVTRDAQREQLDAVDRHSPDEPSRHEIDGSVGEDIRVRMLPQLEELQERPAERFVPLTGEQAIRVEPGEQHDERFLIVHDARR